MFAFKLANFDFTQSRFFCDLVMLMLNLVTLIDIPVEVCKDLVMLMLDFALSLLALPIFSDKVPLCTSGGFRWRAFKTFGGRFHGTIFNSIKRLLRWCICKWFQWRKTLQRYPGSKDHYHDHRLKPQLEDDPLRAEHAQ